MINGKPDPNCPECDGTGIITLLRFDVQCECVKTPDEPNEKAGYDELDYDNMCLE